MTRCKPILCAYNTAAQTIASTGYLVFSNNKILSGIGFEHIAGGSEISILRAGYYFVSLDADIEPAAAGAITVQLYNNGAAVADSVATFTGVADETAHIHLDALIKVLPSCAAVDNSAALQVYVNEAATVTNAKIIVF